MEEKKNVPQIRFKEFMDTWEQYKVEDIGDNFNTSTLGYADLDENGKYKCVLYGELYTRYHERIINVVSRTNVEATEVEKNDILFPTSTTVDAISLISPSCVNEDKIKVGGDLFGIRPYKNIDGNFISYYINNINSIKNAFSKLAQGLTIVHLHYNAIKNQILRIPSLEEQKKMSKMFVKLDNLITFHECKYEKLLEVEKSLLVKMFPKDNSDVPEIRFKGFKDKWKKRKLFDIANYRNGKAHENDIDENGKYVVVNSKFVSTNGEIRKFSNKQNEPLLKNEIAFVLSDVPNGRALARTFLVNTSGKYTLNQRIAGITPSEDINPYYLYILMNRHKYFLRFDDGTKQTNLSIEDMKKFEEKYPKFQEQEKIGLLFEKIDNLVTLHKQKLEKLKNMKKSLLEKMFV